MANSDRNWKTGISELYAANKYWFICSIFFFLLIASVYLAFTPVTYKVATRIVLKTNQAPQEIIKNVKSKAVLQKVIDQLSLRVAYFQKRSSEDAEIPANLSPVKLIMADNNHISSSADLKIFVVNDSEYKILKDRVFTYFLFNEPVDIYPFAKFKIVKSPAFRFAGKEATIRLYSDARLLEEYNKNLDAKFTGGDDKSIELSLTAKSLKKGRTFLDKLVEVYNISDPVADVPNAVVATDPMQIKIVGEQLTALKLKAEKFKTGRAAFINIHQHTAVKKPLKSGEKEQALNLLNAIDPYTKSPVDQFVLIPYGDEVTDTELKKLISRFNQIEEDKQHALQAVKIDHSKVEGYNTQLAVTKQSLSAKIEINKDELNGVTGGTLQKGESAPMLAAVNDSISKINALIKTKELAYDNLLKSRIVSTEIAPVKPKEPVIEKSTEHVVTYPKIGYVYLFALLIGLLLPLVVPYFKLRINVN